MCQKEAKDLARALQQKLNAFGYVCIKESDLDSISEALNTGFNFVCRDDDVEQDIVNTMDAGMQAYRSVQESKGIKLGHCQEVVAQMGGLNGWNSVAALKPVVVAAPEIEIPLTREQKYLQSRGNHCPCCGSKEISGDSGFDADDGSATQEASCDVCNATWDDTYTLSFVDITDEGNSVELVGTPKAAEMQPGSHVFYKTGDTDVPETITDRNGEVVLQQCRLCGKAEGELTEADGALCQKKWLYVE